MIDETQGLAGSAGFDLLGCKLGHDLETALKSSLAAGVVFPAGKDPLSIFRMTLQTSICDIETHERGRLFQRFLRDGPYECDEEIPPELRNKRLSVEETAKAIAFIYSFMVNSFKGAVTELLAAAACQRLMQDPRVARILPRSARLYVGDAVMVRRKSGTGRLKGADLHILVVSGDKSDAASVEVVGVAEVKSGRKSSVAMSRQLERHIERANYGLRIAGGEYPGNLVRIGIGPGKRVLGITVQPSDWRLPRIEGYVTTGDTRQLILDHTTPPRGEDKITCLGNDRWHVSLRWSKEALAAAAYEMTFWYMEKVGEIIYAKRDGEADPKPENWEEMTPGEAGRNAAKMMLYYAIRPYAIKQTEGILQKHEARTMQRAIALYNSYCFGYALGMNFRNRSGRREMLWPKDLDEIAEHGCNKNGCRIV